MSETEPVMQHAWVVRTARDEDFYYRGPLPLVDDIIEVKSGGGVLMNVRVTRVDKADATHHIDGTEIESEIPEESRELPDVTIRVRETSPGFFEASFHPNSPETHLARSGFTVDTTAGAQGHTLGEVLDWAEGHWRLNYPLESTADDPGT